jgi:hypothetical protein
VADAQTSNELVIYLLQFGHISRLNARRFTSVNAFSTVFKLHEVVGASQKNVEVPQVKKSHRIQTVTIGPTSYPVTWQYQSTPHSKIFCTPDVAYSDKLTVERSNRYPQSVANGTTRARRRCQLFPIAVIHTNDNSRGIPVLVSNIFECCADRHDTNVWQAG